MLCVGSPPSLRKETVVLSLPRTVDAEELVTSAGMMLEFETAEDEPRRKFSRDMSEVWIPPCVAHKNIKAMEYYSANYILLLFELKQMRIIEVILWRKLLLNYY